ncbi:TetR/AcrR family transcriptional regulator [Domibacillus sp. DTU_2020_1001157_1_SI_ALB_TIR_016]|uniref:TetR/AcrR family transcriptional regulator n=1 Tax=Domibacillus sp. DTU_2020_1001157_1_SI_ALB_TIR_016 TaxID=3077789 RepID=UPI0028E5CF65|nr:TetR/AcrR family transcriptional regulator [Domibacillus sp. DTU_2020_1001157_1_SI_ALB_TIR_016]WNS78722.1 TetR/AcrR family transcriptional regulator [Domibacillus sp. DTU_2020_1001157_1_SI_ALB_TIR_016]
MTSEKIKEVALRHFAQNGYEGASMANIAEDVGIKKATIYSHFKGKDELFLQICRDASESELKFIIHFIESNMARPIQDFLFDFLLQSTDRYEKYESAKFWIRAAFFPPTHLNKQVLKMVYEYLDKVEELLLPIIEKAKTEGEISSTVGEQRATAAFLGVLDGLYVEMLYGGPERLKKRLDASWHLYWRGLSND